MVRENSSNAIADTAFGAELAPWNRRSPYIRVGTAIRQIAPATNHCVAGVSPRELRANGSWSGRQAVLLVGEDGSTAVGRMFAFTRPSPAIECAFDSAVVVGACGLRQITLPSGTPRLNWVGASRIGRSQRVRCR